MFGIRIPVYAALHGWPVRVRWEHRVAASLAFCFRQSSRLENDDATRSSLPARHLIRFIHVAAVTGRGVLYTPVLLWS